ncbi:MAG: hypothetical protein QOJ04_4658 [Caballeronia sp.]|nr:hypothetical protein [Caballeronia sp.]
MTLLTASPIQTWHAHIYFDATTRDAAWQFRGEIATHFGDGLQLGRFHEKPVGPHPKWSYQLAFERAQFADIVEWLTLNHGALDVFLHPNTGDSLRDHRDAAVWIGHSHKLTLAQTGTRHLHGMIEALSPPQDSRAFLNPPGPTPYVSLNFLLNADSD